MMSKYPSPGVSNNGSYAFIAESSGSQTALETGLTHYANWSTDRGSASSGSKLYIDKVDATAYTRDQVYTAISDTNNRGKYHSIALTDGLFAYGFSTSMIRSGLSNGCPLGELRAMVFYDRVLSAGEITGLHAHFAGDYTSSQMVQ